MAGQVFEALRKHTLPCLLLAYLLAGLFPSVGLSLRRFQLFSSTPFEVTTIKVLLGLLLFLVGLRLQISQSKLKKTNIRGSLFTLASRNVLLLVAFLVSVTIMTGPTSSGVVCGLMLMAFVPVANSSAGWVSGYDGDLRSSLFLILLSTVLCPLMIPVVSHLSVWVWPAASELNSETALWSVSTIANWQTVSLLLLWVIVPMFMGTMTRRLFSKFFAGKIVDSRVRLSTLICLLVLNYLNGCVAMPEIFGGEVSAGAVFYPILVAAILCAAMFLIGNKISNQWAKSSAERMSMTLAFGMANTGIALVIATEAFPEQKAAHLLIIAYTFVQHLCASYLCRRHLISAD